MWWILTRACPSVRKIPRPGGRVSSRLISKLNCQRRIARSWGSRKNSGRSNAWLVGAQASMPHVVMKHGPWCIRQSPRAPVYCIEVTIVYPHVDSTVSSDCWRCVHIPPSFKGDPFLSSVWVYCIESMVIWTYVNGAIKSNRSRGIARTSDVGCPLLSPIRIYCV